MENIKSKLLSIISSIHLNYRNFSETNQITRMIPELDTYINFHVKDKESQLNWQLLRTHIMTGSRLNDWRQQNETVMTMLDRQLLDHNEPSVYYYVNWDNAKQHFTLLTIGKLRQAIKDVFR